MDKENIALQEEKIICLLQALDQPGSMTDGQLESLKDDEAYALIAATRSALAIGKCPAAPDTATDGEPPACHRHPHGKSAMKTHRLLRIAALLAVPLLIAGLAIAALRVGSTFGDMPVGIAPADTVTTAAHMPAESWRTAMHTFRNAPLADILSAMGRHYGKTVVFTNPEKGRMRLYFKWNREQGAEEAIASLNQFAKFDIGLADDTITVR